METLITIHSLWRWVLLIVALATVVVGLLGWLRRQQWSPAAASLSRLFPIAIDIQVLLGVTLWVLESRWGDGFNFYYSILHPLFGILALAVAHIVSARIKRGSGDLKRYRLMALGFLLVLVVLALAVPEGRWSVRGF